jgi:hypothetical protein
VAFFLDMKAVIELLGYRQVGKASDFDSDIPRFESWYPIHFKPLKRRFFYDSKLNLRRHCQVQMTVKELIQILSQFPQDQIVLVTGYEDGYSDIAKVETTKVKLNYFKEDYYGPHNEIDGADTEVIKIVRANNPN